MICKLYPKGSLVPRGRPGNEATPRVYCILIHESLCCSNIPQVVAADEAVANEAAAKSQAIKDECEEDLAEALPALEAALAALNTLTSKDITLVKSMKVTGRSSLTHAHTFIYDTLSSFIIHAPPPHTHTHHTHTTEPPCTGEAGDGSSVYHEGNTSREETGPLWQREDDRGLLGPLTEGAGGHEVP